MDTPCRKPPPPHCRRPPSSRIPQIVKAIRRPLFPPTRGAHNCSGLLERGRKRDPENPWPDILFPSHWHHRKDLDLRWARICPRTAKDLHVLAGCGWGACTSHEDQIGPCRRRACSIPKVFCVIWFFLQMGIGKAQLEANPWRLLPWFRAFAVTNVVRRWNTSLCMVLLYGTVVGSICGREYEV